jgi:hypothetical protein
VPTKYEANTNFWMTIKIFEDYSTQPDRQLGTKNSKTLLFTDQRATHLKNITFLSNIKSAFLPTNCASQLQPLDLGTIHPSSAITESS